MKKVNPALAMAVAAGAGVAAFAGTVIADPVSKPVVMTDQHMSEVVAGVGPPPRNYTGRLVSPIDNYRVGDQTTARPAYGSRDPQGRSAYFA